MQRKRFRLELNLVRYLVEQLPLVIEIFRDTIFVVNSVGKSIHGLVLPSKKEIC